MVLGLILNLELFTEDLYRVSNTVNILLLFRFRGSANDEVVGYIIGNQYANNIHRHHLPTPAPNSSANIGLVSGIEDSITVESLTGNYVDTAR